MKKVKAVSKKKVIGKVAKKVKSVKKKKVDEKDQVVGTPIPKLNENEKACSVCGRKATHKIRYYKVEGKQKELVDRKYICDAGHTEGVAEHNKFRMTKVNR